MMLSTDEIITRLRATRFEASTVEVKAAVRSLPKSLVETVSAFSNDQGGVILLGLTDPGDGLLPAVGFTPEKLMPAVESMLREDIEPPANAEVNTEQTAEGHRIIRINIYEGDPGLKPYYVKARGKYAGSYTRPGEGDRKLSQYEIDRLLENQNQPLHDQKPVLEASLEDLDTDLVNSYIANLKERQPRAFAEIGTEECLLRSRVLVRDNETGLLHPSLAGLLALGKYPQTFYPQLDISVVVLPTTTMGETIENGIRFLDNQTCSGAIPYVLKEASDVLIRNMRRSSVIVPNSIERVNRYDYPLEVIRELLANALMHRDYSPQAQRAQIQVELYPDRLVVRNPGGIYGAVDPEDFGTAGISSSRNSLLARILSELPVPGSQHMVAENRGSGIPSIFASLYRAGMQMPSFSNTLKKMEVTIPHNALITPQVSKWLRQFEAYNLSQQQEQALALMYSGREVTNQNLQAWGMHSTDATQELSDLVAKGLIQKHNQGRWSKYSLAPIGSSSKFIDTDFSQQQKNFKQQSRESAVTERREKILTFLHLHKELSAHEIRSLLSQAGYNFNPQTITNDLNTLLDAEKILATAPVRSKNRKYKAIEDKESIAKR